MGVTTNDKASHEAEDRVKTHSGDWCVMALETVAGVQRARQPPENTAALTHVTYRFGRG